MNPQVPRQQAGSCGGCLAFGVVTLADLAAMAWSAFTYRLWGIAAAGLLLWLVRAAARQYRGID
jgi:hypothetical protein